MKLSVFFKIIAVAISTIVATSAYAQSDISTNLRIYKFSSESSFSPHGGGKKEKSIRYWYKSNNVWTSFSSDEGNKSSFSYRGPAKMTLYKKIGEGNDDKAFSPLTTINLPSSSRDVFVVMNSTGSSASFYPINVSPDKLPKGKIVIMNMTRRTLGLKFGNDMKALRPNANAIFSEPKKRNKGKAIPIAIAAKVQGRWEVSYKSRVHYPENQRCIMLVYDPANKEIPNLNVSIVQF